MTQEDLLSLGFKKVSYSREDLDEDGFFEDKPYYFYAYTLDEAGQYGFSGWEEEYDKPGLELVTNTNKAFDLPNVKGDGWYVEFSDYENIRFYKKRDVQTLIEIFNKNRKVSD